MNLMLIIINYNFLVFAHFILVPVGYLRILLFLKHQDNRIRGIHISNLSNHQIKSESIRLNKEPELFYFFQL